jgi:N-acetylated-alpha-linked acidic dipeptidase
VSVLSYRFLKAGVAFVAASGVLYAVGSVRRQDPAGAIFGFSADSAKAEHALETRFMRLPSAERAEADHKFLTAEPHVAGSPRDRLLAEWTRDRWLQDGLENVTIAEHQVLLPYAQEVTVEMTAPQAWRASLKEDPIPGDDSSARSDVGVPYHAYSASGDVTASVVYAASGNPADYDWLAANGVDVKGKIALVR